MDAEDTLYKDIWLYRPAGDGSDRYQPCHFKSVTKQYIVDKLERFRQV
jgi:hypothetical protein